MSDYIGGKELEYMSDSYKEVCKNVNKELWLSIRQYPIHYHYNSYDITQTTWASLLMPP